MNKINVGINGFGRIGRQVFKILHKHYSELVKVAVINDPSNPATKSHLLTYDSVYGRYNQHVEATSNSIIFEGREIPFILPTSDGVTQWGNYQVDIVLECSGRIRDGKQAQRHIAGGASKVIISAPASNCDITMVLGVNTEDYNPIAHHVISNASCTTNCVAPMVKVLDDAFGIEHALVSTIHAYTGDQRLVDRTHKDLRRARAAANSIIPTTTGAAKAVAQVIPKLAKKLDGIAFRVPVLSGSVAEVNAKIYKETEPQEVNAVFKSAAETSPLKGILAYSEKPLVSCDYIGDPHSCTLDSLSTMVIGGKFVKIVGWYDNEWGYAHRIADLTAVVAQYIVNEQE